MRAMAGLRSLEGPGCRAVRGRTIGAAGVVLALGLGAVGSGAPAWADGFDVDGPPILVEGSADAVGGGGEDVTPLEVSMPLADLALVGAYDGEHQLAVIGPVIDLPSRPEPAAAAAE